MRISNLGLLLLVSVMSACTFTQRKIEELQYPGFLDVGAGYAVAYNTRSGKNNDSDGYLLSIKAYPWGRWYSKPKSTEAQALSKTSELLVQAAPSVERPKVEEAKKQLEDAKLKRTAAVAAPGSAAAPNAMALQECRDYLGKAKIALQRITPDPGWVAPIIKNLEAADTALPTTPAPDPLDEAIQALGKKAEELKKAEEALSQGLAGAIARLGNAQAELLNEEFYEVQVKPNETWWPRFYRRFSVFYATSIGDFEGGGLESSVNAVGMGFDVAPQLALLFGYGYYDVVDAAGTVDTDGGWIAGVSLNLNAFRWMFGDLTN